MSECVCACVVMCIHVCGLRIQLQCCSCDTTLCFNSLLLPPPLLPDVPESIDEGEETLGSLETRLCLTGVALVKLIAREAGTNDSWTSFCEMAPTSLACCCWISEDCSMPPF